MDCAKFWRKNISIFFQGPNHKKPTKIHTSAHTNTSSQTTTLCVYVYAHVLQKREIFNSAIRQKVGGACFPWKHSMNNGWWIKMLRRKTEKENFTTIRTHKPTTPPWPRQQNPEKLTQVRRTTHKHRDTENQRSTYRGRERHTQKDRTPSNTHTYIIRMSDTNKLGLKQKHIHRQKENNTLSEI